MLSEPKRGHILNINNICIQISFYFFLVFILILFLFSLITNPSDTFKHAIFMTNRDICWICLNVPDVQCINVKKVNSTFF